ncbi:MAG: ABC transporter permease subunit [Clostridia bacterium]|nr:ABC transporter permease subunit [Clostridia bacterium]
MSKGKKGRYTVALLSVLYPLITIALVFSIWAIVAAAVHKPLIIPSIGATFNGLGVLLSSGDFYAAAGFTLLRTLLGYIISLALALIGAVCAALFSPVRKLLSPLIAISRAVPTMSVILLCLLWVSNNILPVAVCVVIICPLLYTNILGAIDGVDRRLVQMSRVYGVPMTRQITQMYIPLVLPDILTSVRSTLSLTLKLTIAGEVMSSTAISIGQAMNMSNMYLDTDILFAWTIVAIVLSALLEGGVALIAKLCARWRDA